MILCIINITKFKYLFKDNDVGLTTKQENGTYSFLDYGAKVAYIASNGVPMVDAFCAKKADETSILLVPENFELDYNPNVPFKILYHTGVPSCLKVNYFEKKSNFCGKRLQLEEPSSLYADIVKFINLTGCPGIQFDMIWNAIPGCKEPHQMIAPEYITLFMALCRVAIIAHAQDNNDDLIEMLKWLGWPQFIDTDAGKQLNADIISAKRKDMVLQPTWWHEVLGQNYESIKGSVCCYIEFNRDAHSGFLKMMDSIIQNKTLEIDLVLGVYKSISQLLFIRCTTKQELRKAVHDSLEPWVQNIPDPNKLQAGYAPLDGLPRVDSPWLTTEWGATKCKLMRAIEAFGSSYSFQNLKKSIPLTQENPDAHEWWISHNEKLLKFYVEISCNVIKEIDSIISGFNGKESFGADDFSSLLSSLEEKQNVLRQYLDNLTRMFCYDYALVALDEDKGSANKNMSSPQKMAILIVDDIPGEVQKLKKILEQRYSVKVLLPTDDNIFHDIAKYDAIILDDNLSSCKSNGGYKSGLDIFKKLRSCNYRLPVFGFVSSTTSPERTHRWYDAGCNGVWTKGGDTSEFVFRLGIIVGNPEDQEQIDKFVNDTDVPNLEQLKSEGKGIEAKILWGDGMERLRNSISSNLCAKAEAAFRTNEQGKNLALTLLKKALLVNDNCLQAVYVLLFDLIKQVSVAPEEIEKQLKESFKSFIEKKQISIEVDTLISSLNVTQIEMLSKSIKEVEEYRLICYFENDLTHVDYFAKLNEYQTIKFLGRILQPRLTISVKELANLPSREYSIFDDLVKKGKEYRTIVHRGLVINAKPKVFGPAIDTLWLNEILHSTLYTQKTLSPECICELGCGSGLLLCSLLEKYSESVKRVIAIDTSTEALNLTEQNITRICEKCSIKPDVFYLKGDGALEILQHKSIDVLVTNPPYLPEKNNKVSGIDNTPIFGNKLIEAVIKNGKEVMAPNGLAIILKSSLTQDLEIWHKLKDNGWDEWTQEERILRVPLDLLELSGDPQWEYIDNNNESRRGLIQIESHPFYQYWHDIEVIILERTKRDTAEMGVVK